MLVVDCLAHLVQRYQQRVTYPAMSVELDPPELGFRRPFTHEVTQVLRLRNPNSDPIAFKVKTTAPKQYCVRPNSGRIDAGMDVEIQVLLQAMKEDPPLDARCRDKFLVQSVAISPDQDNGNVAAIWQKIEEIAKSSIQEQKIRVTFLPARDASAQTNGTHVAEDAPPAYGSPTPSFGSAAPNAHHNPLPIYSPIKDLANHDNARSAESEPSSALNTVTSTVKDTVASASQTLQEQLDSAKATIVQLRSQAEAQSLRLRKSDAVKQDSRERITTGTTGMGVQPQPANGVPVQIVAGLCLLSFLLAYFFF